jgi:carboxymethylenebutenolidase
MLFVHKILFGGFVKYGMVLFYILTVAATATDHKKKSCCGPTATAEFALFGTSAMFASAHLSPEPFTYQSQVGGTIEMVKTSDSVDARIYEVKSQHPTKKYLFVIHEWWGLNDYIKEKSEQLQKELGDVNIFALDLYDGKVASDPKSAGTYMGEVKEERIRIIINAVIERAGKDAKIATIGWCFGGGWSLQTSLILGTQAAGCVMYYGMPEKNIEKLKSISCDVLGLFASNDKWITPAVVEEFQKNMNKAKKKLTVKIYDADHAFANPSNPKFDKANS